MASDKRYVNIKDPSFWNFENKQIYELFTKFQFVSHRKQTTSYNTQGWNSCKSEMSDRQCFYVTKNSPSLSIFFTWKKYAESFYL
jgi:hypothetical protein